MVKEFNEFHDRKIMAMGDYGWSMDSGTSQGSVAVEYGRVDLFN